MEIPRSLLACSLTGSFNLQKWLVRRVGPRIYVILPETYSHTIPRLYIVLGLNNVLCLGEKKSSFLWPPSFLFDRTMKVVVDEKRALSHTIVKRRA